MSRLPSEAVTRIFGGDAAASPEAPLHLGLRRWLACLFTAVRAAAASRHGFQSAGRLLTAVDAGQRHASLEQVRDLATRIDWFTALCFGRRQCLFHSMAVCAGLRRLGFDAQVVFGYEYVELRGSPSPVHAWIALGDEPVNAPPSVTSFYFEIARHPVSRPPHQRLWQETRT